MTTVILRENESERLSFSQMTFRVSTPIETEKPINFAIVSPEYGVTMNIHIKFYGHIGLICILSLTHRRAS